MDKFLSRWRWNNNECFYKNVIMDHKTRSLANPFYQTIGIEEWSAQLCTAIGNKNNYFYRQRLKKLVMKSDRFCKPLIDISEHQEPKFSVTVYWNLRRHKAIRDVIQAVLERRFDDPSDHEGIRYILSKDTTYTITIGTDGKHSNLEPSQIISLATFTTIYEDKKFITTIVDYIGTTSKEAKFLVPSYNPTVFTGKGLGKLMINLIQVVSHILSLQTTSNVLIKCNGDLETFYSEIGFVKATNKNELFSHKLVVEHYNKIPLLDPQLHKYYLPNNFLINHKYKSFINHVMKISTN